MERIKFDLLSTVNSRPERRWRGYELRGMVEINNFSTLVLEGDERSLSELFQRVDYSIKIRGLNSRNDSVQKKGGVLVLWPSAGKEVEICDMLRDLCEVHPGPWRVRWK